MEWPPPRQLSPAQIISLEIMQVSLITIQHRIRSINLIIHYILDQPIYENVEEALQEENVPKLPVQVEPYYQVPKKIKEPHYEIPKKPNKSIPLYENVELLFSNSQGLCETDWKVSNFFKVSRIFSKSFLNS